MGRCVEEDAEIFKLHKHYNLRQTFQVSINVNETFAIFQKNFEILLEFFAKIWPNFRKIKKYTLVRV